jgi:hypothetical protein
MEQIATSKIIHVGRIMSSRKGVSYLLLRQTSPYHFAWMYWTIHRSEEPTGIEASSLEKALQAARRHWKREGFRTVICGFRYTLPERDEHGNNALFHHMVASYSSQNGIYFDEELGRNCIVNFASQEAQDLWRQVRTSKPS